MAAYTEGLILQYLERVANAYENYLSEHNRQLVRDIDSVIMLEIIEARIAFKLANDMQRDIMELIRIGKRIENGSLY